MAETIHILPNNDLKEHTTSKFCKCQPRIESEASGELVIHNAWDGREFHEIADEINQTHSDC